MRQLRELVLIMLFCSNELYFIVQSGLTSFRGNVVSGEKASHGLPVFGQPWSLARTIPRDSVTRSKGCYETSLYPPKGGVSEVSGASLDTGSWTQVYCIPVHWT